MASSDSQAVTTLFRTATACHQSGRLAEAEKHYRQVLDKAPNHADALHYLGLLLQQGGNTDEAIALLTRAVDRRPDEPACQNNLGNMLREQGRMSDAIAAYRNAVKADPNYVNAHYNLASVLNAQGDVASAIEAYRAVVRIRPRDAEAWNDLGVALMREGPLDEAVACFQSALQHGSEPATAYNNMGAALMDLGKLEDARSCFHRAIDADRSFARAYDNLARSRRYEDESDPDIQRIEALADEPEIPHESLGILHFALGKSYDDCGSYDKAFTHYRQANDLVAKTVTFRRQEHTALITRLIELFDRDFFAARGEFGDSTERPVFIVGMPRSGTSLVEQVLSSHPEITGGGELSCVSEIAASISRRTGRMYPECVTSLDAPTSRSLAQVYLSRLAKIDQHAPRVTDKTPGNFLHLGLIALLFPDARIIHCRREPMDVGLSIYFQRFAEGHQYAYDLSDIAAYYCEYARLMEHWNAVLPHRVFEVDYETLVDDQEPLTRRMIDFLALPWSDRCLAHDQNVRVVHTASNWQVRQPIYRDSVKRSQRYDKHLDELKAGLARQRLPGGDVEKLSSRP